MDRKERLRKTKTTPDRDDCVLRLLGVPRSWLDAIYSHMPLARAEESRFCDVFSPNLSSCQHARQLDYTPSYKNCKVIHRGFHDSVRQNLIKAFPERRIIPTEKIMRLASSECSAPYTYSYLSTRWIVEAEGKKDCWTTFDEDVEDIGHMFCDSSMRTGRAVYNLVHSTRERDKFTVFFLFPLCQKYDDINSDQENHWHVLERELLGKENTTQDDAISIISAIQLMTLGSRIVEYKQRPPWIQSNVSTNVVTRDIASRTILNKYLTTLIHKQDASVFDIRTKDAEERLEVQPEVNSETFSAYSSLDVAHLVRRREEFEEQPEDDWYSLQDPVAHAKMDDMQGFYFRLYQLISNSSGILCKISLKTNQDTGKASNHRIICPTYWKEYLGNKSGTNKQGSMDRDESLRRSNPEGAPRAHQFFPSIEVFARPYE